MASQPLSTADARALLAEFDFSNDGRYVHLNHPCGEFITVADGDTATDLLDKAQKHKARCTGEPEVTT